MDLFILCGSGSGCGSSAASKYVPTPFYAAVAVAKHFSPIAAPLPHLLPHRVNKPLVLQYDH